MFRIPVCKRTHHLDFPPKLHSNSIFEPQPAETGGAHQRLGDTQCDVDSYETLQLAEGNAT